MKRTLYSFLLVCISIATWATNGDTTKINVFNKLPMTHYGNFDKWTTLPSSSVKSQRVWLKYTLGCTSNGQCEWDYTITLYARQHTGKNDSTLQQAPSFRVNGNILDSVNYSTDTTYVNSFNSTTKQTDSVPSVQLVIVNYANSSSPLTPTDTMKVWPVNYYRYWYDSTGKKSDSTWVSATQTMHVAYTPYYNVFEVVNDYELGRLISPYAATFPKSFQYEYLYDVTDFTSMLHDSVELRINYSGYTFGFTGTMDLYFVEGTPAREASKIENIYNGYFPYGDDNNSIENYIKPTSFDMPNDASSAKLRLTITGHGGEAIENCSEFCAKSYYLKLDNTQFAEQLVWKDDCGDNAIVNQGGTWIYNRANWCPGEGIKIFEYPLNIAAGSNHTLDMDMDPFSASGSAGYAISAQVVYYKTTAHTIDAALEDIIAPSKNFWYSRINPVCANAQAVLRNFGTQALNSVELKYQVSNADPQTYTWTGSLAFDQSATITLPAINWVGVDMTNKVFKIWISKVNGQDVSTDENAYNNSITSTFDVPQVMPKSFIIETRTNNNPEEDSYTLLNDAGAVIFSKTFDQPSAIYRDTFNLQYGCYTFKFKDDGGDGLYFWANTGQGTGSVRFMKYPPAQAIKTFGADFGNFLYLDFRTEYPVGIEESLKDEDLTVYPSPASDYLFVESAKTISGAKLYSMQGTLIREFAAQEFTGNGLSLSGIPTGIYLLRVQGTNDQVTKKISVIK